MTQSPPPPTSEQPPGEQVGRPRPELSIPAGVLAAALGAAVYYLLVADVGLGQAAPLLAVGPIVGVAMRFTSPPWGRRLAVIAVLLTLLGCFAGFMWGETAVWTPFMFAPALRRLLSLVGIIGLAISSYLAWIIAPRA